MKIKLTCPECKHEWKTNYFKWFFTTLFHRFNFKRFKDARMTKCPSCGKKSYIYCEKLK